MSYHWYSDKKKRKKGRKKARQRGPVSPVVRKAPSVSLFKGPVDSKAPTWEPAQRLELRQAVSPLITAWHLELPSLCQYLINTILHALPLSPTRPLTPADDVCHHTQSAFRPST